MFEIKEVSKVEATGKLLLGGLLGAGSAIGTEWLIVSIPAIIAC